MARGDQRRASCLGDGPADLHHHCVAQRSAWRHDPRLVRLGLQMDISEAGFARPLGMVRHRLAGAVLHPAGRRLLSPADDLFPQPRGVGGLPARRLLPAAQDRLRLGLCRHAAGPLHLRHRADRDPLRAHRLAPADHRDRGRRDCLLRRPDGRDDDQHGGRRRRCSMRRSSAISSASGSR